MKGPEIDFQSTGGTSCGPWSLCGQELVLGNPGEGKPNVQEALPWSWILCPIMQPTADPAGNGNVYRLPSVVAP